MPYGLEGKHNEDPKLNTWMENCVTKVMGKKGKDGKTLDKSSAVAICKSNLEKHNYHIAKSSISIDVFIGNL